MFDQTFMNVPANVHECFSKTTEDAEKCKQSTKPNLAKNAFIPIFEQPLCFSPSFAHIEYSMSMILLKIY